MTILTTSATKVKPGAFATYARREQRHQEFLAQVAAATVESVEVKPAQPQQPVCRWSEQTFREYVKRDRMRAINWPSV